MSRFALLFFLWVAAAQSLAQAANVPPAGLHAITDVTIVDIESGTLREHQNVVWDRSRLIAVGPAADVVAPKDARIIPGAQRFLIPGLWDMHVHIRAALAADTLALPLFIAHGVTAVRDMGESLDSNDPYASEISLKRRWSEEAAAGIRVGPRLLGATGFTLNGPSMVRDKVPAFFGTATPAQAREVVHYLKDERGADFIKVYSGIPRDAYFAVLDEAKRTGIPVVGHKPMRVSFVEASDAGQRSIEHAREIILDSFPGAAEMQRNPTGRNLPPQRLREILDSHDPAILQQILAAMVRNRTYYCPTHVTRRFDALAGDQAFVTDPRLSLVHPAMRKSWLNDAQETQAKTGGAEGQRIYNDFLLKGMQITSQANGAGVKILAGTDAGDSYIFYGATLHDELELLVRGGLSPRDALRAATIAPAEFADRSSEFGSVATGKIADMVLLDANPLADIKNTRRIANVIFNGRSYDRAALDGLVAEAQTAVKALEKSATVAQPKASARPLAGNIRLASRAVPTKAFPERFTLQQSIDAYESAIGAWASYATETLTSPQGRYVAWNERSDLWVALAPDFEPRPLTQHGDGVEITDLYALPDGESLLYVRERDELRELWRANTATRAKVRIATGKDVPRSAPVFAPNGESFVVSEDRTVMGVKVTGDGLQRERLLDRDDRHANAVSFSEFAFSPDGSKLAFVSQRAAGQSYIGVVDMNTRQASYLDPSIYQDSKPSWSLDGRQLAFLRVPGNWVREHRFIDKTAAAPWSIQVWNAKTGRLHAAWQAEKGRGSYPPPKLFHPTWTRQQRLIFAWEKTGWPLLYSVPASGGGATLLTPGEGEIGRPRVSSDAAAMVFETNLGDLGRSHLWRLSLRDGTFEPLTRGDSVEQLPGLLSTGDVVYLASERGRMPLRRVVRRVDGSTRDLTPLPVHVKANESTWRQFVDTKVFSVTAEDGVTAHHLMMQPSGAAPAGGFPVIVICKGGPISRVLPGDRYGDYTPFAQYAVSRGYKVVFMNYRGSAGLGLEFRYPPGRGATGGSEVKDLAALARYLKSDPQVNEDAIGIMGYSYGGHLVGLALDKLPDDYRAGVHMSGIGDWTVELQKDGDAMPDLIALSERLRADDLAALSSPDLQRWCAPVLFTIGDADRSGHVEAVIDLGYRLLERGVAAEFQLIPGATHGDLRSFPMQRVFDFFERTLRPPAEASPRSAQIFSIQ